MSETKRSPLIFVHVAVMLAFMFLFRYVPAPPPLTTYGMAVLGIFIGMIYGWTFIPSNGLAWVAFAALFALGNTEYGTVASVMNSLFASDTAILLLFGMLLVGPITEAHLGDYLVAKLLNSKLCKGKPWNFTIAIVVILPLLSLLINAFIIAVFMVGVFTKFFKAAGYKKGDKYPVMLIIGFFLTMMITAAMLPCKNWGLYVIGAFAKSSGGYMINGGAYMIISFIFYFALGFGYVALMKLMRCDVEPIRNIDISNLIDKSVLEKGLNKQQKALLTIIIAIIIGCVGVTFLAGDTGIRLIIKNIGAIGVMIVAMICMLLINIDGKPITTINVMGRYVMWDMIMVIATAMVIAGAMTSAETGISAAMGAYAAPLLMGKSGFAFLILLAVISLVLTNVANNVAVMFVLITVAGGFYANGIITNAPAAMMIIGYATLLGFYTPAASAYGAMIHSHDAVTSAAVYKYGFLAMLYILVLIAVVLIPLCNIFF